MLVDGLINELVVGGAIIAVVITALVIVWLRQKKQSLRLQELLKENYEVGKILVRRDMELSEANTRLIALDQSKSEFVSIAAHQLRTPLTGIRWTFNALYSGEFGELNPDQRRMVQSGLKSSVRMIDLINDLLNVARIEEGRFGMHFVSQPFSDVLIPVMERIRTQAINKGIKLMENLPHDLPDVSIDSDKMSIALENVLENAIKYTPPGGQVEVSVSVKEDRITMTTTDSGIGIPKEQLERIFSKFFRADNALRFQTFGSGLGLYVVKNVIEAHNGQVHLESEEQKGTTVTLSFPIKRKRRI